MWKTVETEVRKVGMVKAERKTIEAKRIAEEWKIWSEEVEVTKKLVPEHFYK